MCCSLTVWLDALASDPSGQGPSRQFGVQVQAGSGDTSIAHYCRGTGDGERFLCLMSVDLHHRLISTAHIAFISQKVQSSSFSLSCTFISDRVSSARRRSRPPALALGKYLFLITRTIE